MSSGVEKLGFSADNDTQVSDELRFVQLTPPGSACSLALTSGARRMAPGSLDGLQIKDPDGNGWALQALTRRPERD